MHGGVDGYSRYMVFCKASNNNRSLTVKPSFMKAAEQNGIPSRVRMDRGGENQGVKDVMEGHRGPGRGSAIMGRSVHNIRIERAWVDVVKDALGPFHDTFTSFCLKEDEGGLGLIDLDRDDHLWALHYVFMPRVNFFLEEFARQRNLMPLESEGEKTPTQLFAMGMLRRQGSSATAAQSFWNQELLAQDWQDTDEDAGLADFRCPLSEEQLDRLRNEVNPLEDIYNDKHAENMLRHVLVFA